MSALSSPTEQPWGLRVRRLRPIVCDWDGGSTVPGPSRNSHVWREVLAQVPGLEEPVVLNRRLGELIPAAVTACALSALDTDETPLLLGGDHRLSYSALNAVVHRASGVEVHQFDAHHDAYRSATLNNFSVFRFATERLGVPVVRHGCREPLPADLPPVRASSTAETAYLSIDLDYLDPADFASVSFPVPAPSGMSCTVDTLTAEISQISGRLPIVACDVVEWCADRSTQTERQMVVEIVRALADTQRTLP